MSKNKKVCIFNKNHMIGNKSLPDHYYKSHKEEYLKILNNGWVCNDKIFLNQAEMDKHMNKCEKCQKRCGIKLDETTYLGISNSVLETINKKLPKNKKHIDFPVFDFSKYIIPDDKTLINLDSELVKELIEEEKNIV